MSVRKSKQIHTLEDNVVFQEAVQQIVHGPIKFPALLSSTESAKCYVAISSLLYKVIQKH